MWPWIKKDDAPLAAVIRSEPPASLSEAPTVSDDIVWVDLLECSLSEAERDTLHSNGEEPPEFARGVIVGDGKDKTRRVHLEGHDLELSVHAEKLAPANPAFQDDLVCLQLTLGACNPRNVQLDPATLCNCNHRRM